MKNENIFITGATGFIGISLVKELAKTNSKIRALVRKTSDVKLLNQLNIELVYGDVQNYESFKSALDPDTIVYHCAGYTKSKPWEKLYRVNVEGTDNICRAVLERKAARLIHISSAAVIGGHSVRRLSEELSYCFMDDYARSKSEGEKIVLKYREKGVNTVILRPCMTYGFGEEHIFDFLAKLIRYHVMFIPGKGNGLWPVVYIDDVVDALLLAKTSDISVSGIYLIAGARTYTITQIMDMIADILGVRHPAHMPQLMSDWAVVFLKLANRLGVIDVSFARAKANFFEQDKEYDISKARRELRYNPKIDLREGLTRTLSKWGGKSVY
jgi:nucleoside-diphosphate-sugar epimerase